MTVSQLDLRTALIVIDLQKIVASMSTVHPFGQVLENAGRLARLFRQHVLPWFWSMSPVWRQAVRSKATPGRRFQRIGPTSFRS